MFSVPLKGKLAVIDRLHSAQPQSLAEQRRIVAQVEQLMALVDALETQLAASRVTAAMPVAINQGFIAMKCNERASNFFMLNWCQTNMAEIESRATGTAFAEICKQNFRPIRVMLPPKELMAAFTAKVAPLYAQITANLHQSRTLGEQTRCARTLFPAVSQRGEEMRLGQLSGISG